MLEELDIRDFAIAEHLRLRLGPGFTAITGETGAGKSLIIDALGILLGDRPRPEDPEAEHLHEDIRAELFGTTDVQESIAEGIPWNPPDGPTPEGASGTDAAPDAMNDDQ